VNGLGSIRGWLFTIQINIFRNEYRRRARIVSSPILSGDDNYLSGTLATASSPEDEYLQQERHQILLETIAELSEQHRQVILLVDMDELSYQEVADRLNIPIGTVRSRVFRARRLLAKVLAA